MCGCLPHVVEIASQTVSKLQSLGPLAGVALAGLMGGKMGQFLLSMGKHWRRSKNRVVCPKLAKMMRLLLTAFTPFGGRPSNASQDVARALKNHRFDGIQIEILELPVERFRAPRLAIEAVARFQPDVVVMLGEAWTRPLITPERVAFNRDDFAIPDNAGHCPREEKAIQGAPDAYFSTLPLLEIETALQRENIACAPSHSAGAYLCNHLFFHVMHHLTQTQSAARAGFIHIPAFGAEIEAQEREMERVLSREAIIRGVGVAIETCLKRC